MFEDYKFSGDTLSCWTSVKPFKAHTGNTDSAWDVVVVGGGIAGLMTAYLLAKEGRLVSVLDPGPIASGQTSRTTAHLSFAMDDGFDELIKMHGHEKTKLITQSHRQAIECIGRTVTQEKIDCDFTYLDGYLFLKPGHSLRYLKKELAACQEIGLSDVELLEFLPAFKTGSCLKFPRQAQIHPLKFAFGLAKAIEAMGGRLVTDCRVEHIEDGDRVRLLISNGTYIEANQVVVATNSPINNRMAIHTKQAAYRTYAVAARIKKGVLPLALYWDTESPYHYVRLAPDDTNPEYDLLIVGGEDHKTGQDDHPEKHFIQLERWAKTRFPQIEEFTHKWSGQIYEPADKIAFIGRNPGEKNTFVITGDSGQGMTYGAIGAMLLTDLLQGRENALTEIYNPSRAMTHGGFDFVKENLNTAWQYMDYLKPSEVANTERIPLCEGAVIRRGAKPIACYRRIDGKTVERSAVCTHLGGIVHWNSVEKTWDCPCHGSRFNVQGKVITGPATEPLAMTTTVPDTFAETGQPRPPETSIPPNVG